MQTDGFDYLRESCPHVLTVLLEYVARVNEYSGIANKLGNELRTHFLFRSLPPAKSSYSCQGHREHSDTPREIKMLFFSYFKDLVGREVTVELKNDLAIRGTLHSVDQYLNIKLENTRVVDEDKYPHMRSVRNCFIRGSVVRYVQLPPDGVDIELLHDATRREARGG
ncbi:hypothetical protein K7X08_011080 [Anisodus acutangulus]|nr:hypothetical protein K7X08_011080 [Anisodus acutangulus]